MKLQDKNWQFALTLTQAEHFFVKQYGVYLAVGTDSASLVRPRRGLVEVFFSHVTPSAKKGAKVGSRDKEYCRFCRQDSNAVIVSWRVRGHCFGARIELMFIQFNVYTIECVHARDKREINWNDIPVNSWY